MGEIKKIDYKELPDRQAAFSSQEEQKVSGRRKGFSLGSFRNFWSMADKKMKLEVVIFAVIMLAMFGALFLYFSQRPPRATWTSDDYELSEEEMKEDLIDFQ